MFDLTGKNALVTGATGGIGAEIAKALHAAGASVAISGTRAEKLEELAAELGDRVHVVPANLSDRESVDGLAKAATEAMGSVDILVNNAGVTKDNLAMRMKDEEWDTVLQVNLESAFRLMKGVMRGMMKSRWGRMINITSVVGVTGNPGQANYVAANGYLEGLARKRRAEGKPALAIAWGAISDAGYLARNEDVNEMLSRKLGRHALTAKEALDGLMTLLAPQYADQGTLAALGYARIDWQAARKDLSLVGTPLVSLLGLGDEDDAGADGVVDLAAMLEGMDQVTAAQTVAKLLATEIGKILRISPEEIDPHKPLSDIGMDSLMALELRMSAEQQLGIDIPLMSLANGATLIDLSSRVANRVLGEESASGVSDETQQLASLHMDDERHETEDLSDVAAEVENKSRELGSFL